MVSFWCKDVFRLNTLFRGVTKCQLGDGKTVCCWDDLWANGILSHKYPRLASFFRAEGDSVFDIVHAPDLDSIFMLPLSEEAF